MLGVVSLWKNGSSSVLTFKSIRAYKNAGAAILIPEWFIVRNQNVKKIIIKRFSLNLKNNLKGMKIRIMILINPKLPCSANKRVNSSCEFTLLPNLFSRIWFPLPTPTPTRGFFTNKLILSCNPIFLLFKMQNFYQIYRYNQCGI